MANFIIAKIIGNEKQNMGFRVFNFASLDYEDTDTDTVIKLLNTKDSDFLGFGNKIINATIKDGDVLVDGYDDRPVIINTDGTYCSGPEYTLCSYNPVLQKFILISYSGKFFKLRLPELEQKVSELGAENIANLELLEQVKKQIQKDLPPLAYTGENERIIIPEKYKKNELVNLLYGKVNSNLSKITDAFILHTKTQNVRGVLRHYELDDNGNNIGKDDTMNFDIDNSIVNTFFVLETMSSKFITVPVCEAFKPLIESFKYSDMTAAIFQDFLDFLADNYDDLELADEKNISEIMGGVIVSVTIENDQNVTYEVINSQPQIDYDKMDATFIVEIKDKKRPKEYILQSFPWVMY